MKCFTNYSRRNPDTINGEILVVTQKYTTFDSEEMNRFEKSIRQTIGSGVMSEFKAESEEV